MTNEDVDLAVDSTLAALALTVEREQQERLVRRLAQVCYAIGQYDGVKRAVGIEREERGESQ